MHLIEDFDAVETTVGQIVARDIRAAEVFKRLDIDFCCNGKRTLLEACERAGVSVDTVIEKLAHLGAAERLPSERFDTWNLEFLTDYIVNVHHRYLYENLPFTEELVHKVAYKHGDRYPSLRAVQQTFDALKAELLNHLQKEEMALFPFIRQMVQTRSLLRPGTDGRSATIQGPVTCMEHEHDDAGTLLFQIRALTSDYEPPVDACNSHRLMLAKLAELEADLMQHIHLENNILFPKALQLEKQLA